MSGVFDEMANKAKELGETVKGMAEGAAEKVKDFFDRDETCIITLDGTSYELPIVVGSEGERAIDISSLRRQTGYITLDDGYGNTGSCASAITFIDGENGILRYRGVPIEDLASRSSFIETAQLLIFGELPNLKDRERFASLLTANAAIHRDMRKHFEGFPVNAHPMAILSAMVNVLGTHELPDVHITDLDSFERAAAALMSKARTIAAAAYKAHIGEQFVHPRYDLKYAENFLHMMFTVPYKEYEPSPEAAHALNMFLVLHADHEQNCSTTTVRTVASSGANLFASCSAGINALWGPRHGGANQGVIDMHALQQIVRCPLEDLGPWVEVPVDPVAEAHKSQT